MLLPSKYQWLNTIGPLPKMISAALQYLGVKEIPGAASNPVILDMAKGLGVDDIYVSDSQSWCALFINHIIRITSKPIDLHPHDKYDLLRAKQTANLFNDIPKEDWRLGDIMIIKRDGGGHVFFPIAKTDKNTIIGLGGNQSNSVTFSEFDANRVIGVKRFYAIGPPDSAKQYIMNSTGELSVNEA